MRFDYSLTKKPVMIPAISLMTVYKIQEDLTYNVYRNDVCRRGFVALRTIEGGGILDIEGLDSIEVHANTLIVFENPKINHYMCAHNKWTFWWFEFLLGGTLDLPLNKVLEVTGTENEYMECTNCLELIRKDIDASNALASAQFGLLFHKWIYSLREIKLTSNPHNEIINKAIHIMYEHISEDLLISDVAKQVGFSSRRFQQIFKDAVGMTPKQYFTSIRLKKSEQLLLNTSCSISQISYELGFSSPFHFSKAFKEFYGICASEYRKIHLPASGL